MFDRWGIEIVSNILKELGYNNMVLYGISHKSRIIGTDFDGHCACMHDLKVINFMEKPRKLLHA